jgi:hypothetical protein
MAKNSTINLTKVLVEGIGELLEETVEYAAIRSEMVDLGDNGLRQIGKTSALINVAKKYNVAVIVPTIYNPELISSMRDMYDYPHIYTVHTAHKHHGPYFTDEGVDLQAALSKGLRVVTGYISNKIQF